MNLVSGILLSVFSFHQIPEIQINDEVVINALNASIDSLRRSNDGVRIAIHLTARLEKSGNLRVLYVGSATSIGGFKFGLPDSYSRLGSHLVFWYDHKGKTKDDNENSFKGFQNQFGDKLVNDLNANGDIDGQFNPNFLELYKFHGAVYYYKIDQGRIAHAREISRFPDDSFYERGYAYDSNGNLMYVDGVYDPSSFDRPCRFDRDDYDPMDYIRVNSKIPREITRKYNIGVTITIDKKGKPVKVSVVDKDHALDQEQIRKIEEVVLGMPNWNAQTVAGKKVRYRLTTGL